MVPTTERQMPKRRSNLETPIPPQDSVLCDMGVGGTWFILLKHKVESVGFSAQILTDTH